MNRFIPFSKKQLAVLNWWCNGSDVKNKNGIICDGAVRSGKTLCMVISFICWSFYAFLRYFVCHLRENNFFT